MRGDQLVPCGMNRCIGGVILSKSASSRWVMMGSDDFRCCISISPHTSFRLVCRHYTSVKENLCANGLNRMAAVKATSSMQLLPGRSQIATRLFPDEGSEDALLSHEDGFEPMLCVNNLLDLPLARCSSRVRVG